MLVAHEGRLIPIEEPIDLAKRRLTPHPHEVIDLTDDSDDVMLDSSGLWNQSGILPGRRRSRHLMKRVRQWRLKFIKPWQTPLQSTFPRIRILLVLMIPLCPSR